MEIGDKPVRDGTRDWRILITKEDVEGAVPRSECDCAIAKAIKRTLAAHGRFGLPSVGREVVIIVFEKYVERYLLSPNTHAVVRTFDQVDVFPEGYTIELRAPKGTKRLGQRGPRGDRSKERGPHTTKNENFPYYPRHVKQPRDIVG